MDRRRLTYLLAMLDVVLVGYVIWQAFKLL